MSADCFLDTNILFYAALGARKDPDKQARARELIGDSDFAVSTQVLQEFYVNVTRKADVPLTPAEAMEWVEMLAMRPCVTIDSALVRIAIGHSVRYRIAYWDAALIAAAQDIGAPTLFTEDLSHGQFYGTVQVVNPFRPN